jgi:uncharacterized membrane protein YgcG
MRAVFSHIIHTVRLPAGSRARCAVLRQLRGECPPSPPDARGGDTPPLARFARGQLSPRRVRTRPVGPPPSRARLAGRSRPGSHARAGSRRPTQMREPQLTGWSGLAAYSEPYGEPTTQPQLSLSSGSAHAHQAPLCSAEIAPAAHHEPRPAEHPTSQARNTQSASRGGSEIEARASRRGGGSRGGGGSGCAEIPTAGAQERSDRESRRKAPRRSAVQESHAGAGSAARRRRLSPGSISAAWEHLDIINYKL